MSEQRPLADMTPDELCRAYLDALRVQAGDEVADASRVDYEDGWYYVYVVRPSPARYVHAFWRRRARLQELVRGLRERMPKEVASDE